MKGNFQKDMEHIVAVLREAGYDPYEQLYAYIQTGNETYITRKGDARDIVVKHDRNRLWEYILPYITYEKR